VAGSHLRGLLGPLGDAVPIVPEPVEQHVEQPGGGLADHGAGREDRVGTTGPELVEVGGRDHPADDHEDVLAPAGIERGSQLWHQGQVAGGQ
jgi:hypothetical protein